VVFRDGTLEYDMATPRGGNFMGAVFHATSAENSEVVFFRPAQSGTMESVQYAPALNGVAAAWQVYHGDDANAAVTLAFNTWLHVRIDVTGVTARLYLDNDTTPVLTPVPPAPAPPLPHGTIVDWDLSQVLDASQLIAGALPDLAKLQWDKVHSEAQGFVLVNRYRRPPQCGDSRRCDGCSHGRQHHGRSGGGFEGGIRAGHDPVSTRPLSLRRPVESRTRIPDARRRPVDSPR
jgi:hypothetical protein